MNDGESITHRFTILAGDAHTIEHTFYLTVVVDVLGRLAAMTLTMKKRNDSLTEVIALLADTASLTLALGANPAALIKLWRTQQWEPRGKTSNELIPTVTSPIDYVARWLQLKFDDEGRLREWR